MKVQVFVLRRSYAGGILFPKPGVTLKDYLEVNYGREFVTYDSEISRGYQDLGLFEIPDELLSKLSIINTVKNQDSGLGWREYHAE